LAHALASLELKVQTGHSLPTAAQTLLVVGTEHPVTRLQLENLVDGDPSARVLRIRCEAQDEERIYKEFKNFDPQALIFTGGDTALLAARALGAHSFLLRGEFAPGIPWGLVQGGAAHNRVVITKSGGFGSTTIFSDIFNSLSGRV